MVVSQDMNIPQSVILIVWNRLFSTRLVDLPGKIWSKPQLYPKTIFWKPWSENICAIIREFRRKCTETLGTKQFWGPKWMKHQEIEEIETATMELQISTRAVPCQSSISYSMVLKILLKYWKYYYYEISVLKYYLERKISKPILLWDFSKNRNG